MQEKSINPEKFALAVVASSSYQLSINEKLELYSEAYDAAEELLEQLQSCNHFSEPD